MSYAKPYTQLYCHVLWTTYDRLPLITPELEPRLHAAILAKVRELHCEPLAVGGIEDHVHLLCRLHPAVSVADLVEQVKGVSSHLVTHEMRDGDSFRWQTGYAAYTIQKNAVPAVQEYVLHQKEHHAASSLWVKWETTEPME